MKHLFSLNPLLPAYRAASREPRRSDAGQRHRLEWLDFDGGLYEIGHAGDGFAYDNESPRHRTYLEPFQLASRPVDQRRISRVHRRRRLSSARAVAVARAGAQS